MSDEKLKRKSKTQILEEKIAKLEELMEKQAALPFKVQVTEGPSSPVKQEPEVPQKMIKLISLYHEHDLIVVPVFKLKKIAADGQMISENTVGKRVSFRDGLGYVEEKYIEKIKSNPRYSIDFWIVDELNAQEEAGTPKARQWVEKMKRHRVFGSKRPLTKTVLAIPA